MGPLRSRDYKDAFQNLCSYAGLAYRTLKKRNVLILSGSFYSSGEGTQDSNGPRFIVRMKVNGSDWSIRFWRVRFFGLCLHNLGTMLR